MKHTRFTTALVSVSALVAVSFLTAVPAKAAACSTYGGGNNDLACRQVVNLTGPDFPLLGVTNTYQGTVGNTGVTNGRAPTQTTQGPTTAIWEFPSEWTINSVTPGTGWTCNAIQNNVAPGPDSSWSQFTSPTAQGYLSFTPVAYYPAVSASSTIDSVTCTYTPSLIVDAVSTNVTIVVTPPLYTQAWHAIRAAYIPITGNATSGQAMIGNSITGWGGTVLSYDINGGTGTTPASDPSLNGFSTTNVATGAGFSKAGYTFGGWNCNQSIGIKAAGASLSMPHDPAAVDVLCTAIWTATAYQLSYDAGGGTGTVPSTVPNLNMGNTTNLNNGSSLSKSGYTFNGWSCDQSIGAKAGGATVTMPAANVLCTAQWTPIAYQLSYNAGGGTGTTPSTVPNLNIGNTPTLDSGSTLSKTGYTFAGWSCDQSIGAAAGSSQVTMPAANVICTAQWTANATYQLSYNAGGGSGTVPSTVTGLNQGNTPTLDAGSTLSKTGYTFAGWNCDQSIGAKAGSATVTMPAANVICTAQWTPNSTYQLSYNAGGGTGTVPSTVTGLSQGNTPTLDAGSTLSRTGYTFAGWNCDQSIGAKAGSATVTMPAANVICTAQWTPTSSPAPSPAPAPAADIVNLNYIGNGGTCSAPNQTAAVTAWVYANSGATCSRPGYTFQGWNNSPNGNGIAIGPNGPLQLIADTTLYAIWKPVAVPSNPSQAVPVIVPVGPSANPDLQLIPIDSTQTVIFTPSALSQASPGSRFKPGGVWIAPQGTDKWTNKIIVPGKGTWILTGDKVRFRPSKGFIGRSTIRYRIQDVNGQWAYSTLTVAAKAIPKDIVSGVV